VLVARYSGCLSNNQNEVPVAELLLDRLEARRARLYEQLTAVGDFRRGSISENWRRCGKPGCRRCAEAGSRGHGPRWLWTRSVPGRGTVGRQLKPDEVEKVRGELAAYEDFAALAGQIAEVNEAICEARPTRRQAGQAPDHEEQKKGSVISSPSPSRRRQRPR
jgi:hypothetical protein